MLQAGMQSPIAAAWKDCQHRPPPCYHAACAQDDVLFHNLTVRETFEFAANMRLPAAVPAEVKSALVTEIITELGLVKAQNTFIGVCFLCVFFFFLGGGQDCKGRKAGGSCLWTLQGLKDKLASARHAWLPSAGRNYLHCISLGAQL